MTVLYIVDYGTVGGATHAFIDMAIQMKALGVTPIVVTSGRDSLNSCLEKEGIRTVAAGHYTVLEPWKYKGLGSLKWFVMMIARYWRYERQAIRFIESELNLKSVDLIHTNSARNSLGCYLSKKHNIPHIMHIREFADTDFGCKALNPFYINLYNKYSSAFISISDAVKNHWTQKGIDASRNIVIYDGVYNEDILPTDYSSIYDDTFRMVIVGGVCEAKGQLIAVEAISKLPTYIRDHVSLDIIGWQAPEYMNRINNYICEHHLEKQVSVHGARNDIHEILHNYHVGLMCSRSEGFGLVTAEYMHAGLPVIASNSGACPELIEDKSCGLIFESGNSIAMCNCIEEYFKNRNLLEIHGKAARIRALDKFTRPINGNNIYNIYKSIIHGETTSNNRSSNL